MNAHPFRWRNGRDGAIGAAHDYPKLLAKIAELETQLAQQSVLLAEAGGAVDTLPGKQAQAEL